MNQCQRKEKMVTWCMAMVILVIALHGVPVNCVYQTFQNDPSRGEAQIPDEMEENYKRFKNGEDWR